MLAGCRAPVAAVSQAATPQTAGTKLSQLTRSWNRQQLQVQPSLLVQQGPVLLLMQAASRLPAQGACQAGQAPNREQARLHLSRLRGATRCCYACCRQVQGVDQCSAVLPRMAWTAAVSHGQGSVPGRRAIAAAGWCSAAAGSFAHAWVHTSAGHAAAQLQPMMQIALVRLYGN